MIFANPIAGRGRGMAIATELAGPLQDEGYAVRLVTERPESLDADSVAGPTRAAIVIGGDGTLRAVAQRLYEAGNVPPLLTVPLGTANLMGQHLGIRWEFERLALQVDQAIAKMQIRLLDAGRANGGLFLLMAGIGFDAHVVHALDRMRTGPIRYTSYLWPTALALGEYRFPAVRVIADGREVFPSAPAVAFVGNVAEYGTGFPVLPQARPDDGLLDVCILPTSSLRELAQWFLLAAAGEHTYAEGAIYLQARHVRVETLEAVPVQIDGDAAGNTPFEADLLPVRLPFIVP